MLIHRWARPLSTAPSANCTTLKADAGCQFLVVGIRFAGGVAGKIPCYATSACEARFTSGEAALDQPRRGMMRASRSDSKRSRKLLTEGW